LYVVDLQVIHKSTPADTKKNQLEFILYLRRKMKNYQYIFYII